MKHHFSPFVRPERARRHAPIGPLTLAAACLITGCGGGESGPVPNTGGSAGGTATASALGNLQGLWEGTLSVPGVLNASAIALPDGQMWLVAADPAVGVRLVKVGFSAQGSNLSATGKNYVLGATPASNAASATATVQAKTRLTGTVSVGASNQNFSLTYNSRYDTAARLADFAGDWNGAASNQVVTLAWRVSDSGAITGSSTTGCSYTGTLKTRTEAKAVLDAAINENCAGSSAAFTGVATLNADKSRLSVAASTADGATAALLSFQR
jgi:hypothetical protein